MGVRGGQAQPPTEVFTGVRGSATHVYPLRQTTHLAEERPRRHTVLKPPLRSPHCTERKGEQRWVQGRRRNSTWPLGPGRRQGWGCRRESLGFQAKDSELTGQAMRTMEQVSRCGHRGLWAGDVVLEKDAGAWRAGGARDGTPEPGLQIQAAPLRKKEFPQQHGLQCVHWG